MIEKKNNIILDESVFPLEEQLEIFNEGIFIKNNCITKPSDINLNKSKYIINSATKRMDKMFEKGKAIPFNPSKHKKLLEKTVKHEKFKYYMSIVLASTFLGLIAGSSISSNKKDNSNSIDDNNKPNPKTPNTDSSSKSNDINDKVDNLVKDSEKIKRNLERNQDELKKELDKCTKEINKSNSNIDKNKKEINDTFSKLKDTKNDKLNNISDRHSKAHEFMRKAYENINRPLSNFDDSENNKPPVDEDHIKLNKELDEISKGLNDLLKSLDEEIILTEGIKINGSLLGTLLGAGGGIALAKLIKNKINYTVFKVGKLTILSLSFNNKVSQCFTLATSINENRLVLRKISLIPN